MSKKFRTLFMIQFSCNSFVEIQCAAGGIFITAFALFCGFTEAQIGMLAGIWGLANVMQAFSFILYSRVKSRKKVVMLFQILRYISFYLMILTPAFVKNSSKTHFVMAFYLLVFVCQALIGGGLIDWNNFFVRSSAKGNYYSMRNLIVNAVNVIFILTISPFLDHYGNKYSTYLFVSVVMVLFAAVDIFVISRIPDRIEGLDKYQGNSIKSILLTPLKCADYRHFIIFSAIWSFSLFLSAPYYNIFLIKYLNIPYTFIATVISITAIIKIISSRILGKAGDKNGWHKLIQYTGIGYAITAITWLLIPVAPYIIYPVIFIFSGIFIIGFNISLFNLNIELTEGNSRLVFWGFYAAFIGLCNFLSPNITAAVTSLLDFNSTVLGVQVGPLQVMFLLTGLLQLLSIRYATTKLFNKLSAN